MRILLLTSFIIFLAGCVNDNSQSKQKNQSNETLACIKYNKYYDTLKAFISDLSEGETLHFDRVGAKYGVQFMKPYFVENVEKWKWLPYSLYDTHLEIKKNIQAIKDSLKACNCPQEKDESFIVTTIEFLTEDINKLDQLSKQSLADGTDMFMDGVKLMDCAVKFDSDMNPILFGYIQNETTSSVISTEVAIEYCDIKINNGARFDPKCYEKHLLKFNLTPFSKTPFKIQLDKTKYESRSEPESFHITKIVKDNGELVDRRLIEYSE